MNNNNNRKRHKLVLGAGLMVLAAALAGCGDKDKAAKPGQALASVNGEEITALQLNDELQRANVPAAQQDQASKQLLEVLIDRQLLLNEADKEKLDRDPKVMQAIERAKATIIAQAYMQKKIGTIQAPTAADISDYFNKHPEFFSNRQAFIMEQLLIDSKDLTEPLKQVADSAKSIEEVAAWLAKNNIAFERKKNARTTTDLTVDMSAKLKNMPKNKLFVVREGARSMLVSIVDVQDAPVALAEATPHIHKFLLTQRHKEAADAELKRLRATAKLEYLNKAPATAAAAPAAATPAPAPAVGAAANADADAAARGVAGLK